MPTRSPALLAVAAALIAAIALLAPARAADPPPSDAITLNPGLNAVGWVSAPEPVARLFSEIPRLNSVWTWDPWDQRWIGAARDLPPGLRQMDEIRPGSAALLVLHGEEPTTMERPLQVAAGTVPLARGRNVVAWLGRDGVALDHALRGIGRSLDSAQLWDPDAQSWVEPAEEARIDRGDPIAVTVDWAVDWLQPTYVMPPLTAPGRPDDQLAIHRGHLAGVLEFFDDLWSIQADPFRFDIYVPRTFNALRSRYYEEGRIDDPDDLLSDEWQRFTDGWSYAFDDRYVLVPAHVPRASLAFGVHAHEYAHILQNQLNAWDAVSVSRRSGDDPGRFPAWVIEGSAEFAQVAAWRAFELVDAWWRNKSQRVASSLAWTAPRLEDVQFGERGFWEYDLGLLAFEQLSEAAGANAAPDLFRARKTRAAGPGFRWLKTPSVEQAFAIASGIELDDFYLQFAQWQCERIEENAGSPPEWCRRDDPQGDAAPAPQPAFQGVVSGPDDAPVSFVQITACPESSASCQPSAETWTGIDGNFTLPLPPGRYKLQLQLGDDCPDNYEVPDGDGKPATYDIGPDGSQDIRIEVPLDACGARIEGRVRINSDDVWRPSWISASSGARAVLDQRSGRFWVTVPAPGRYSVTIWLDPITPSRCELADGGTSPIARESVNRTFDVPDQGLTGVEIVFDAPPTCEEQ